MPPSIRSILTSGVVHAALLAAIIWGPLIFLASEPGGSGGEEGAVVSVWLAGPDGRVVDAAVARRTIEHRHRRRTGAMTSPEQPKPSREATKEEPSTAVRHVGEGKSVGAGAGLGGAAGAGVGSGSGEGVGSGEGGDPVLATIWKRINRAKYYPSAARRLGLEGAPGVTFSIAADGSIAWVKLSRPCGIALLDNAALEAVRRAAPLPRFAKPITLTLRYSLDR